MFREFVVMQNAEAGIEVCTLIVSSSVCICCSHAVALKDANLQSLLSRPLNHLSIYERILQVHKACVEPFLFLCVYASVRL